MNNLKESNIRKRQKSHLTFKSRLNELLNLPDKKYRKNEMFHLKSSIECLERVMSNEKTIYL